MEKTEMDAVAQKWIAEMDRLIEEGQCSHESCAHCHKGSPVNRCKITGFLFCSNPCQSAMWNEDQSLYKFVHNTLIAANGKRGEREGEEEEDPTLPKKLKDVSKEQEKQLAKGRSVSAQGAAEWIIKHGKASKAANAQIAQLLEVLRHTIDHSSRLCSRTYKRRIYRAGQ